MNRETVRIISLCPSLTELVCDLGLTEDLVAITRYCVHPADVVAGIEKVGGPKNPQLDRIVELAPDLVLLNEEENRREDADALAEAGVPCHTSLPVTPEDTAAMVRSIGDALDRPHQAEAIALDIEQRARRVREAARGRPKVRWAYLIWRKPWMVVNADTFIDALLSLAGGVNVFGDHLERYPAVSTEEIVEARPDVVLLATEPFPFEEKHIDELSAATGLTRDRFRIVDGELLSWHGSRTPRGIDYAEQVMLLASK